MAKEIPRWMGKPVTHADDAKELSHRAALHEFGSKMSRTDAEARAHREYAVDKRLDAAAHHLMGMKAAHSVGDMESARKHGVMYDHHMQALGMGADGTVPPEVLSRAEKLDKKKIYQFKAHPGDVFSIDKK